MTKGGILTTLGLIGLLSGCEADNKTTEEFPAVVTKISTVRQVPVISTVRQVPVLEYNVRKGDISIKLIQRELEGSRDFSIPGYGDPRATEDEIRMYGDDKGNALVSYFFTVPEILKTLNGDRSMQDGYWRPYEYPLMAGERLLVPDFNLDGKINDVPRKIKGNLRFDCSRDFNGVTKKINY